MKHLDEANMYMYMDMTFCVQKLAQTCVMSRFGNVHLHKDIHWQNNGRNDQQEY